MFKDSAWVRPREVPGPLRSVVIKGERLQQILLSIYNVADSHCSGAHQFLTASRLPSRNYTLLQLCLASSLGAQD